VWALQNQDGNSTLTVIDPDEGVTPSSPIPYAVLSASRGVDDVVFRGNRTFLSYTNPTYLETPTIQMLVKGTSPLAVTTILTMGATGTNLATGQRNQPTTQNDPDSLKLTPFGDLQLSSGADGQLIFVRHPGTDEHAVSFLTLLDPATRQPVTGLDDAVFATATRGVFYLADTGNNRIPRHHGGRSRSRILVRVSGQRDPRSSRSISRAASSRLLSEISRDPMGWCSCRRVPATKAIGTQRPRDLAHER